MMGRSKEQKEAPCQKKYGVRKVISAVYSLHFRNVRMDIRAIFSGITYGLSVK